MTYPLHTQRRPVRTRITAVAAAVAFTVLAPSAQARNVRLMESVTDTARATRAHEILGNLEMRFGAESARSATIVRRDVVVTGTGGTKLNDVGEDARVRPTDHDLCARAFEDAVTQLTFAARGARASAIVGVVSSYEGRVFDDPTHFECHAGAIKAVVTLRAQLAVDVPVLSPPAPMVAPPVPVYSPPPAPDVPAPPAPTFQPLPPLPAPAPAQK